MSQPIVQECNASGEETLRVPRVLLAQGTLQNCPPPYPDLYYCAEFCLMALMENRGPQNQSIGSTNLKAKPSSIKLESPPSLSLTGSPASFFLTYRAKMFSKEMLYFGTRDWKHPTFEKDHNK